LAFTVLSQKGELNLLSPEQVAAKQQLQNQVRTGEVPTPRRASSVSTTSSASFYSRPVKKELTENDLYSLPLEELEQLAGGRNNDRSGDIMPQFGRKW